MNIEKLLSVYEFKTDQKNWVSKNPRTVNIVSYQVDGHYDHSFSFGKLKVKKDHVFKINPKDAYSVERVEQGSSICFAFISDTDIKTELVDCSSDPRFLVLFRKLLKYRNLSNEASYYMALSVAYEILALISEKKDAKYFQASKNLPFYELRTYINENYGDSALNIKEFSKKYKLSDKYLRDRFRELFGMTPTNYLIDLRLSEASRLISGGTHTVGETAEAVGFSDIYYFSRLFKKRFGFPPTDLKTKRQRTV